MSSSDYPFFDDNFKSDIDLRNEFARLPCVAELMSIISDRESDHESHVLFDRRCDLVHRVLWTYLHYPKLKNLNIPNINIWSAIMHCLCEGPLFEHVPVVALTDIIRAYLFERSAKVMNDIINSMPAFKSPDGGTRLIINWYSYSGDRYGKLSFTNLYTGSVISIIQMNDRICFNQIDIHSLGKLLDEPIPGPLTHYLTEFINTFQLKTNMPRCHEI